MAKLLVSLTSAKNDTDKATVAFVVANASVASGVETVVFLSTEGARLSQSGRERFGKRWRPEPNWV